MSMFGNRWTTLFWLYNFSVFLDQGTSLPNVVAFHPPMTRDTRTAQSFISAPCAASKEVHLPWAPRRRRKSKDSRGERPDHAKTDIIDTVVGVDPYAVRSAELLRFVGPRAAAQIAMCANAFKPRASIRRRARIGAVPAVLNPLPHSRACRGARTRSAQTSQRGPSADCPTDSCTRSSSPGSCRSLHPNCNS